MARRVRFWVRMLGGGWILLAVALFFVITNIDMDCIRHHLKLGHTIMREAAAIRNLAVVVPSLFCLGLLAVFRVRWGIWAGVAGGTLALLWLASQLSYWRQYEMAYATAAAEVLAGALFFVIASGGGVLWLIHGLSRAGISYHWNPSALELRWHFEGQPVDRRLVVLHARRHWLLGWSWIFTGLAVSVAVFPCFLWLPEGYHRPTATEWTVAAGIQGLAILLGAACGILGWKILKRDGRALFCGIVAAYGVVIVNSFNLMIAYDLPPFYTDMAFIIFVTLIVVGLVLAALSHSTLWLHREVLRQHLPVTIQPADLVPQD